MTAKERLDRNFNVLYTILWPIFHVLFPMRVIGWENIPDGPVVICPNHTKWNDPFYIAFAFTKRFPMRAMAKAEIIRWPIVGPVLAWAGVFGVERGSADVKAVKTALKHLKEGSKLLLFPEGTRVHDGEQADAKTGAALFATRSNVPLLPVFIQPGKRLFHRTCIVIGTPYMAEYEGRKPTTEELQTIADDLMVRVHQLGEAVS